jgi:adenylate cyclase
VTVLFCDLRGFTRSAEEAPDMAAFCERVSEALNVMAEHIVQQEGVIGDFQGDAAMGFWGWPEESEDQVARAAAAALGIFKKFQHFSRQRGHALADFHCGIGIAHGPGIAGRLGAYIQFKVGVFGPTVNRAARLESLTKTVGSPILLDENAARKLAGQPKTKLRLRRVARVMPYGIPQALMVSELLPPAHEPGALLDRDMLDYEAALDNFMAGRWDFALGLLERLPHDKPGQFLREHILAHKKPGAGWNGAIVMDRK